MPRSGALESSVFQYQDGMELSRLHCRPRSYAVLLGAPVSIPICFRPQVSTNSVKLSIESRMGHYPINVKGHYPNATTR